MGTLNLRRRVEFADTDMAGIAHFTAFFRYMETAEHELFRSLGIELAQPYQGRRLAWPRVSCSFDFRRSMRFGDLVEIRIGVEKIGTRAITYRASVFLDGELLAAGRSTSVCCEFQPDGTMAAVSVPEGIRAALRSFTIAVPPAAG